MKKTIFAILAACAIALAVPPIFTTVTLIASSDSTWNQVDIAPLNVYSGSGPVVPIKADAVMVNCLTGYVRIAIGNAIKSQSSTNGKYSAVTVNGSGFTVKAGNSVTINKSLTTLSYKGVGTFTVTGITK